MKQIFTILFILTTTTLLAQTLYTRKDTIPITQDSITLQAGQFRGIIQWQHSTYGQTWEDLVGKTSAGLKIASTAGGYYRAQITDGTCLPTYSDTAVVFIPQIKNTMITDPDKISGTMLIDRDNEKYTFVVDPKITAPIPVNTVFVDTDKESDIRVVTSITQKGDTLTVKTEPGTMEDLFMNQEFKLSTKMMTTVNKSAYLTTSALAKAMKDGNGVIHPVEVIDNNAPANNLKSAQSIDESLPGIYFRKDFSNETIWNEGGATITFDQAYYQLGAELNYEFKFEQQGFDWKNLQFPKGKLTKFKICTDKEASGIEAKMIIKVATSHEFKKEDTKVIRKDAFNKIFKYLVFVPPSPIPIPFWATVKVDLMRGSSSNISGKASISGGATGNFNLELGVNYENGNWTTIKPTLTPKFTLEGPNVDAKVNVQASVEVYPHVEVAFYSTLAPYFDIAPYLREEMEYSNIGNYKYDLYTGVNARIGIKAEVFGENLFDYKTDDLNLYEKSLYTAPKKVQVVSGSNQNGAASNPLPKPIIVKVLDSKDNPVKNAIVNFKSAFGKLAKALSNKSTGQKSALLAASDNAELSVSSDSTGIAAINWTIADTTAKQKLEAYLKNGKDFIIEESKDTVTAKACGCDERYGTFRDSRDGHTYKTIEIGTQTWMAENLSFATDSDSFLNPISEYGRAYTYDAAMKACPAGWHLPTIFEWGLLTNYLGGDSIAGGKLKEAGTAHWLSPNTAATNSSCFTALPGGHGWDVRDYSDPHHPVITGIKFVNVGEYVHFYSSSLSFEDVTVTDDSGTRISNDGTYVAYCLYMYYNVNLAWRASGTKSGGSVRCIRN